MIVIRQNPHEYWLLERLMRRPPFGGAFSPEWFVDAVWLILARIWNAPSRAPILILPKSRFWVVVVFSFPLQHFS